VKRTLPALCLALAACTKASTEPKEKASAEPSASVAPDPPPSATAATSVRAPGRARRPPAPGASREEREKAALELLSGKARTWELPVVEVDQGEEFAPALRTVMAQPMEVRIGEVSALRVDKEAARKAVERRMTSFRLCYAAGLRANPNLQGRVAAHVTVTAAGKPLKVDREGSDLPDGSTVSCVVRALERTTFPVPEGPDGEIVVPIVFSPAT
jgi:hypothetical protein